MPASTDNDRLSNDPKACYKALASRDARFDGKFFVGVASTGIYCRPVCRVRLPKAVNCRFYESAAAAEHAGFRPCLLCRPENAPGWCSADISHQLALNAATMMRNDLHAAKTVTDIAAQLGVTDRHLRRVFEQHLGVKPIDYLQTQRRLMARRLLAGTKLTVTDVAVASGFSSTRRLQASFRQHYQCTPGQLRQQTRDKTFRQSLAIKGNGTCFLLSYREPYDFNRILRFLSARSLDGVEYTTETRYSRTLLLPNPSDDTKPHRGWIHITPVEGKNCLSLVIDESLLQQVTTVIAITRHLFDLDADPQAYLPVLGDLATATPGLRLPGAANGFELAVRAVLGQQITVKAARTLATRFVHRFGQKIDSPLTESPGYTFPQPATIARARKDSIAKLGIIGRRADTIRHIAKALNTNQLDLSPTADAEATITTLKAIPGIGDWTAHYLCMRALHWPDAFPAADYGVMKALQTGSPAKAKQAADAWRPWRAYAVMHLWRSLEQLDKKTKT